MNNTLKVNWLSIGIGRAFALGLTGALLSACGGDGAPPDAPVVSACTT